MFFGYYTAGGGDLIYGRWRNGFWIALGQLEDDGVLLSIVGGRNLCERLSVRTRLNSTRSSTLFFKHTGQRIMVTPKSFSIRSELKNRITIEQPPYTIYTMESWTIRFSALVSETVKFALYQEYTCGWPKSNDLMRSQASRRHTLTTQRLHRKTS